MEKWYNKNRAKYPSIILGAVIHNQFENIHPFADGNGGAGRILLNNVLMKHKLPPLNISFSNRIEYYKAIREYVENKNLKPTINLFLKEYKKLKKEME